MGPEIIAAIAAARQIIAYLARVATLAQAEDAITPEQLQEIKDRAGVSDAAWDEMIARGD